MCQKASVGILVKLPFPEEVQTASERADETLRPLGSGSVHPEAVPAPPLGSGSVA